MSTEEFAWTIEKLGKKHGREQFSCGNAALDDFLKTFARQNDSRGLGRTYVAVRSRDSLVTGYYTVAAGAIQFEVLPDHLARSLPRYPLPVLLLARLAVDQRSQRKGLGEHLLLDALARATQIEQEIGIHAVVVEAIDENAGRFYRRYGFEALKDNRLHLILSMKAVRKLFPSRE